MNKKLLLSVIAICCFLYQPSLASDTVSVPKIEGLTYHDARELLMNRGWLPYSPHEDDEITADNYEILSGNGPVFWDMGYHELKRCFGNGFVTCSFVFENEQKVQTSKKFSWKLLLKVKRLKGLLSIKLA
jgi:hypothetical protein